MNIELENDSVQTFVVIKEADWSDQTKELLLKMLKAVKLEDNQFQIIQLSNQDSLSIQSLINLTQSAKILIFGLTPKDVHLNLRAMLYKSINLEKTKLLFSDSLSTLIQKPALKKPLWNALQTIFS